MHSCEMEEEGEKDRSEVYESLNEVKVILKKALSERHRDALKITVS